MIHELMGTILKFAPTLATALGSPAAGVVTSMLAQVFEGDPKDIGGLIKKINADPNCQGKLCTLEDDHADIIQTLLNTRAPSKIDLHIVVNYDTEHSQ